MFRAEIQTAAFVATVRLCSAHVGESAIDNLHTVGMVTERGHTVANVPLPHGIEADCPAHRPAFVRHASKRELNTLGRIGLLANSFNSARADSGSKGQPFLTLAS